MTEKEKFNQFKDFMNHLFDGDFKDFKNQMMEERKKYKDQFKFWRSYDISKFSSHDPIMIVEDILLDITEEYDVQYIDLNHVQAHLYMEFACNTDKITDQYLVDVSVTSLIDPEVTLTFFEKF